MTVPPIISGLGKATNFKFGRYIQSIHANKSPLKTSRRTGWSKKWYPGFNCAITSSQRRILRISWHQFVRNEEVAALTGLSSLSDIICHRRSAIFGHIARLGEEAPAHKALRNCISLSLGRLPDLSWKSRPGRPRGRWIDQLRRDNSQPPADLWRQAINRGHNGRATQQSSDYATTWPDLITSANVHRWF